MPTWGFNLRASSFKIFLWGMPPRTPNISILRMIIALRILPYTIIHYEKDLCTYTLHNYHNFL